MTEKRYSLLYGVDENPYEWDIIDNEKNSIIYQSNGIAICKELNDLHEENQDLRILLNQCSDQRNEFHRGARENANRVGQLEKENKELKEEIETLHEQIAHFMEVGDVE